MFGENDDAPIFASRLKKRGSSSKVCKGYFGKGSEIFTRKKREKFCGGDDTV